jgi:hypothetical protein
MSKSRKEREPMLGRGLLISAILIMSIGGTQLCALSAGTEAPPPEPGANQEWGQASFHGLVVGQSKPTDVLRVLGKPKWKGGVEEPLVPSDKEETQYRYEPAPQALNGDVIVYFGKPSGLVTGILFYPKHMTRAGVLKQFGGDFEVSNTGLGPCPTDKERRALAGHESEYGEILVYRKLGLYINIDGDSSVYYVAFVRSCR